MTDREKMEEMFRRANIEFKTESDNTMTVEYGYIGFYTYFTFNEDGSLKSVEAYE